MHIAEIAPLAESVPPKLYGGTERVVHWLTEELVTLGDTVTLFASGGSTSRAEVVSICPRPLRLGRPPIDPTAAISRLLEATPLSRLGLAASFLQCACGWPAFGWRDRAAFGPPEATAKSIFPTKLLRKDEARRIAANIAKLPDLLRQTG